MSENYIIINGKKAELTREQLKALGIKTESDDNPFADGTEKYVETVVEPGGVDRVLNNPSLVYSGLAFKDKDFAKQVALHQLLYRRLLKYAYDTNTIGKWDDERDEYGDNLRLYFITKNVRIEICSVDYTVHRKHLNTVYFCSEEAARDAINKVIKLFEKEHPEFIW